VLFGPKLLFQTFSKAEKLVFSAIERLKTGDFEEELLEIAKLQISKNYIQNIERTSSRGYLMGMIFNQNRDWEDYLKIPQKINQLTKTDVQNLAQKYFTGDMMLFKSRTGFPKKSKLDKPPVKGVVVDQKSSSEYAKNFKNIPYSKDEPRFLDFNKDVKTATVNSHVIHHVQNPINELYNLRMVIKTGTYENPLLAPAISMMSHAGTEAFSKNEFKKQMAKLGSTVYFDYDIGKITVNLSGLEKNVDKAIKLLNELLQNPVIDSKALKIVQNEFKSERKFILKDPSSMGQVLNSFVMYGDRSNYLRQNSLKEIKKGETVGYDGLWQAKKNTSIGIIPIGYSDGIPLNYGNKGVVLVNKTRARVIGRVAMDLMAIELPNKKIQVGEDIILWGKDLKVDELAIMTDNIPYSFMTSLSKRVKRKYIK